MNARYQRIQCSLVWWKKIKTVLVNLTGLLLIILIVLLLGFLIISAVSVEHSTLPPNALTTHPAEPPSVVPQQQINA